MALDSRYKWFFPIRDVHERDQTFAIGIDNSRVIVQAPTWFKFCDPKHPEDAELAGEMAEKAGYALVTASYVVRGLLPPPESTQ